MVSKLFPFLLPLLLLELTSCATDTTVYAYGDAVTDMAESYCEAHRSCFPEHDDVTIQDCKDTTYRNFCENADRDCGADVGVEGQEIVLQCTDVLDTYDDPDSAECWLLTYVGAIPPECSAFFTLRPE